MHERTRSWQPTLSQFTFPDSSHPSLHDATPLFDEWFSEPAHGNPCYTILALGHHEIAVSLADDVVMRDGADAGALQYDTVQHLDVNIPAECIDKYSILRLCL